MRHAFTLLMMIAAASAAAQAPADRPLVETAPVVGWGDYAWLLPIVNLFVAFAAWYILRRRRAGL